MEIKLKRLKSDSIEAVGYLEIDGEVYCFTLEDACREVKIPTKTRIPMGRYEIKLRNAGGMTKKYQRRYGSEFHKGMLHLQNVPYFEWIYIHTGNEGFHTDGCILTGYSANIKLNGKKVTESRDAYMEIYPIIRDEILKGERVFIQVIDE